MSKASCMTATVAGSGRPTCEGFANADGGFVFWSFRTCRADVYGLGLEGFSEFRA